MIKAVVIDDDKAMRENLHTLLGIYVPEVEILGEAEGVKSGIEIISQCKPDVVFLDIEMKDGSGFDLLSIYGDVDFSVIFVTGHDGFALKAFKYSAIDYVLKPIDPDDLKKAVSKAMESVSSHEQKLKASSFIHNKGVGQQDRKLLLKDANSIYLITLSEIIRCQSETNYTTFFLTDNRQIIVSKTLKEYDELLGDAYFFRVHQSHLINLMHFSKLDKADGGTVYMKDGSVLPVAVRRKELLLNALEQL